MEVNKILDFLESFRDLGIVRFVAGFYREGTMGPLFRWIDSVGEGMPGHTAKVLLVWAVVLIIAVFIVDQVFYLTVPGRLDECKLKTWNAVEACRRAYGQLRRRLPAHK